MQTLLHLRSSTPKEIKRFVKFLVVGSMGFAIDFLGFNILNQWFGLVEVVAQTISFLLATISNFIWNYFWIYPEAQDKPAMQKMGQFGIVTALGLVIGVPVFTAALFVWQRVVPAAGLDSLPFNLAGNLALMTRVGIVLFWNFFANRRWTYGDVK